MAKIDLRKLQTESRNPRSANIDQVSTTEVCEIIHREDRSVAAAVTPFIPVISAAVDALAPRVRRGGRVIYVGAGTSGRFGVLDASEIPPTFSAPFEQFVGVMAGGDAAIRRAQEGAEDSAAAGRADLERLKLDPELDSLIGIAASGRTPYVLGALDYAKHLGCVTIAVVCCSPSAIGESGNVDFLIAPVTGPEVVTGSTRMKAGTATKLILNMLSTAVMIKALTATKMVDVKPSNEKLVQRSRNIIRDLCGDKAPVSDADIDLLLQECGNSVKLALGVLHLGVSVDEARQRLDAAGGVLARAIRQEPPLSNPPSSSFSNLVLCVDGGATKCAAVIIDPRGNVGEGLSGPCNVYVSTAGLAHHANWYSTCMEIDAALATISLAADRALRDLARKTGNTPPPLQSAELASTWIGMAGYKGAQLQPLLQPTLTKHFRRSSSTQLRISNDIDLLSSALLQRQGLKHGIALVAGTGSIALKYAFSDGVPVRIGRAGGWGHLLGDDGSGFALGRAALRSTLSALDMREDREKGDLLHLSELPRRVLAHLQLSGTALNTDVIMAVMAPAPVSSALTLEEAPSLDQRTRIAGLGRVVVDAAAMGDTAARAILEDGVQGLLGTLLPLLTDNIDVSCTFLILGGALLGNQLYRGMFLDRLREKGYAFAVVDSVADPAQAGAKHLREELDAQMRQTVRIGTPKL